MRERFLIRFLAALALPTALESKFYTVDTDLMTDETKISSTLVVKTNSSNL